MRIRVISGMFGGRVIDAPQGFTTHPMSERMRNALFNKLGSLEGKTVLDPFAGSGAISLEAVSRGAGYVVAIEKDRIAQKVIAKNMATLGVKDSMKLISAFNATWSNNNTDKYFDIIICDPPYNDLQLSTIEKLSRHLKKDGLMVLSHPGREPTPTVNGVVVVDTKIYGNAALAIYRKA